jgi:hypothetical protein
MNAPLPISQNNDLGDSSFNIQNLAIKSRIEVSHAGKRRNLEDHPSNWNRRTAESGSSEMLILKSE